jgi:hypothetical protein
VEVEVVSPSENVSAWNNERIFHRSVLNVERFQTSFLCVRAGEVFES